MSKRINSVQHASNKAATDKAASPLTEVQAAVPGVSDAQANPFVRAAGKVAVGKQIKKVDPRAHHDADADKAHHNAAADTAHETAPVESTMTGGARMVMDTMNASDDQAASGSGASSAPADDHGGGIGAVPIVIGAAVLGGVAIAAFGTGHDDVVVTPPPPPVNNAPVISSNGGGATAAVNVFENSTVVTAVTASDADAGQTKTFSLNGGTDAALFNIDASTGALSFKAAPNFEIPTDSDKNNTYVVNVKVTDNGSPAASDEQVVTVTVVDVNEGPSAAVLTPATATIAENSNVTGGVKVATLTYTDDALGTETLTLTGADAASFEIRNTNELFFKGTSPNFEAKASYAVTVNVDDTTIGAAGVIETSQNFTLTVTDVNEAPTAVALTNVLNPIAENSTVTGGVKVATIAVTDDALGTEVLTLTGADAASFEIRNGFDLFYIGTSPNFEAKSSYAVTVNADDTTIGAAGSVEASQAFTLNVTDVNEAPTAVALTNVLNPIAENSTVTGGVKVATIAVTDDALGNETLTLTGADAASFEIRNGSDLFYIGTSPNFEAKASYAVTVNADDPTIGAAGSIEASQAFTLTVTNIVDVANLPTSGTFDAGVQAVGQTDTNFRLVDDGNVLSSVIINNFTANDVLALTNSSGVQADVSFSRDVNDAKDLRIDYLDVDTSTTTTIILNDVFAGDLATFVFSESTAATAMGQAGRDFFQFG